MTKPVASVLIDTYNHERYIEQAVVSAIEQDFPASGFEILVVDDGSTDRTPEIVRKFAPRVRLLSKKNGGQASAFNAAIPELRGEIVAFLDGDDWFAPGKLSAVTNALDQNPEVAAVGHGYHEFQEETGQTQVHIPECSDFFHLATPEDARKALPAWRFLLMGALTIRKRFLDRALPIPEPILFCADTPVFMAAMAGGALVLKQALFYYRHHSANLHAFDPEDPIRLRRKLAMHELALELSLPLLIRLGVRTDSARALVYPPWVVASRRNLATFGGGRLQVFGTEMRAFRSDNENPSFGYFLFKYLVVGAATILLPARRFYAMRAWYGRRNLGRLREQVVGGTHHGLS